MAPVAWCTVADVKRALGLTPADTVDDQWLGEVVDAANAWATKRRAASGYDDTPADGVPPEAAPDNADVRQGAVYLAVWAYRTRGTAGDRTASFVELGGWSTMPETSVRIVNDFLGIPRPVVA